MEELFGFIYSIFQFILTLLDAFFGTNHDDNNKPNQQGGKKRKIYNLR